VDVHGHFFFSEPSYTEGGVRINSGSARKAASQEQDIDQQLSDAAGPSVRGSRLVGGQEQRLQGMAHQLPQVKMTAVDVGHCPIGSATIFAVRPGLAQRSIRRLAVLLQFSGV